MPGFFAVPRIGQPQTSARLRLPFDVLYVGAILRNLGFAPTGLDSETAYVTNASCLYAPRPSGMAMTILPGAIGSVFALTTGGLPLTQCTVLLAGKNVAANTNGNFGANTGSVSSSMSGYVPYTGDGTVYWDFGGNTEGATRLSCPGLSFSDSDVWAFTTGPRGMEIWQNGLKRASNAAQPTRANPSLGWGVGLYGSWDQPGSEQYWYAAGFSSSQLPSSVLANLTQSPQSMYSTLFFPRTQFINAPAGVVVDPILSNLVAINITASGATPRVNYVA